MRNTQGRDLDARVHHRWDQGHERDLLTTDETAGLLDCKQGTLEVNRCLGRGDLPYVKIGRSVRYRRSEVLAYIERHTVRPQGDEAA